MKRQLLLFAAGLLFCACNSDRRIELGSALRLTQEGQFARPRLAAAETTGTSPWSVAKGCHGERIKAALAFALDL